MSSCSPSQLTFPHWDGGSRKIRHIYLVNKTSFRLTEAPNQEELIPLYLGADVLSNTDVRTENHPRYHAKFAKKGLATKLQFSSEFRFHGLKVPTSNNSLWFYSIQGLFRVAFDLYSKQEQLSVLENLQDAWKSRINDSPLDTSYSLSAQVDMSDTRIRTEILHAHSQQVDIKSINTGCTSPELSSTTEKTQLVSTVRQKLHSLDQQLSNEPPTHTDMLEILLRHLETIDRYIKGNLDEKDVTETVLALLKAKDWDSAYSSPLLSAVGRWLGQRFYAANGSISQRVEDFKVQHIEQISDLPPAEELATELFPEAMQTLLLHWMGLSEESALEKRRSEFPILLLILEFANHNLITGVAHVLYSSLICK